MMEQSCFDLGESSYLKPVKLLVQKVLSKKSLKIG